MFSNLIAEMARKGYTRGNLAERIGIAQNSLWKKLTKKTDFTLSEIQKICELFEQPFEYLFEEIESERTA